MPSTKDFRNGLKIEMDGQPYIMVEFQHVKPGKGGAFVRTKLKNLKTGRVLEKTFRSGESVGAPDIVDKEMQYLYRDGDMYIFMDTSDYEQLGPATEYSAYVLPTPRRRTTPGVGRRGWLLW